METTFLYALLDPESGDIRYVGKSNTPERRVQNHLVEKRKSHRTSWLKNLKSRGLFPKLEILLEVPLECWQFWERQYIKHFRDAGVELVNGTEGGEGTQFMGAAHPMFGKPRSAETREKIRLANLRRGPASLQTREKMSLAHRGSRHPMFGKKHSPETREKIRCARAAQVILRGAQSPAFGRKPSEDTRKKMSRAQSLRRLQERTDASRNS